MLSEANMRGTADLRERALREGYVLAEVTARKAFTLINFLCDGGHTRQQAEEYVMRLILSAYDDGVGQTYIETAGDRR